MISFQKSLEIATEIADANKSKIKTVGERKELIYNAASIIFNSSKEKNNSKANNEIDNVKAYADTIKSFILSQNILNKSVQDVYIAYIDSITKSLIDSFN